MTRRKETPEKQLTRSVGALIAVKRKEKGITQADLAEYMGIEKETVSRMETGVISPTLARMAQLAKFLDCKIGDLVQTESGAVPDMAAALARRMGNLAGDQRDVLIKLFGNMASTIEKLPPRDRKVVAKFLSDIFS